MAFASKKIQQTSAQPIPDFESVSGLKIEEEEIALDDMIPEAKAVKQLDLNQNDLILGHTKNQDMTLSTYSGRLVTFKNPRPIEYPNFFTGTVILDKDSKNMGMVDDAGKIVSVPMSISIVGNAELEVLQELEGGDVLIRGRWKHDNYGSSLDTSRHGFITYPQLNPKEVDWKSFLRIVKLAKLPFVGKQRIERLKTTLPNVQKAVDYLSGEKDKNGGYRIAEIFHDVNMEHITEIVEAWNLFVDTQKDVLFLLSVGLSQDHAKAWVEKYKGNLPAARLDLQKNPWSLVLLDGVGFRKADEIALGLGFAETHPKRLREALIFGSKETCFRNGDTQVQENDWLSTTIRLLKIPPTAQDTLDSLKEIRDRLVEAEDTLKKVPNSNRISPMGFYKAEARLSLYIAEKMKNGTPIITMDKLPLAIRYINEAQMITGRSLDDSQLNAVLVGLTSPIAIMTGGPGSGKTTTLQVITYVAKMMGKQLSLAAPTGRAAKRMNDQIKQILPDQIAGTLHRTLEVEPISGGFKHNQYFPLNQNTFVVDESSMIDAELACSYIQSIPQNATLLIVGDANQLPSVSPGAVLNDIIESGAVPVAYLEGNHRSKDVASILDSARRVLTGQTPNHKGMIDKDGYTHIPVKTEGTTKNPNRVAAETLVNATKHLLDTGILPDQIQVIMPTHGSPLEDNQEDGGNPFGTVALNKMLRPYFNRNARVIEGGAFIDLPAGETDRKDDFFIGDRVMVTKNSYKAIRPTKGKSKPHTGVGGVPTIEEEDLSLFNGDMGIIKKIVLREPLSASIIKESKMASQGLISADSLNEEEASDSAYMELDMEDGRTVKVDFKKLKDLKLKLGYVITIHKSQGSERDVVVIGLGDGQRHFLNRNLVYTAITRAKKRAIVITQGKAMEYAVKNMGNRRETGLATFIKTSMKLSKAKLAQWVQDKGVLKTSTKTVDTDTVERKVQKTAHFAKKI